VKLYFLRHGLAGERSEWKGDDAKRPLTDEGKEKTERAATAITHWGLALDLIISSPYDRAFQTAEIVARKLEMPDKLIKDDRLTPGFDVSHLSKLVAAYPTATGLLFVGHEPDFSQVISQLIGGGRILFKKGGFACVDLPDPKSLKGELLWLVTPKLMT
jgi:phosphohistidine phosphatase